MNEQDVAEQAKELLEQIQKVDVMKLPVMARDRHMPRNEQSALARKLFKQLGLKGILVRKETGRNCFMVNVQFPALQDDRYVREQLLEILARSFPQHDDRSEHDIEYYDFKWAVHGFTSRYKRPQISFEKKDK